LTCNQQMATSTPSPSYNNVDPLTWVFGELKKGNGVSSGIRIKQSASNSASPMFLLERMRAPFGCQEPRMEEGKVANENSRWVLTLNVDNPVLQQWLARLDEHLIQYVSDNSTTLFNRVIKRSTVEDVIYYRALHPSKNGYSPTFKIKVNVQGQYKTNIKVNVPGTSQYFPGTVEDVLPHSEVVARIQANQIWVTATQVGVQFVAKDLLVFQPDAGDDNPFEGFTEVARPVKGVSQAAPAGAVAANAAAGAASPPSAAGAAKYNYDEDEPQDMF
jgi:hypothetical protein